MGNSWYGVLGAAAIVTYTSGAVGYVGWKCLSMIASVMLPKDGEQDSDECVMAAPVLKKNADLSAVHKDRAREHAQMAEFSEALDEYTKAILLDYNDHEAFGERAGIKVQLGRYLEACCDADTCVTLCPTVGLGYLHRGEAQNALGNSFDAYYSFLEGSKAVPRTDPHAEALEASGKDMSLLHLSVKEALQVVWAPGITETIDALNNTASPFDTYLVANRDAIEQQLATLSKALLMDCALLSLCPRVAELSYDKSVYICSLTVSLAPAEFSRLGSCENVVKGLVQVALRGWKLHHGFAKFAAWSLVHVVLADDFTRLDIRRTATQQFFTAMLRWLNDTMPRPDIANHDLTSYEVCGCFYMNPRHSASTWLEQLFQTPKDFAVQQFLQFPDRELLLLKLAAVAREEGVIPLGICHMLVVPQIARIAMESDMQVNLYLKRRASSYMSDSDDTQLGAPEHSFGDWLMATVGYITIASEDNQIQASRAAQALLTMVRSVPDGAARLASLWVSLPLLRSLSTLACHCGYALELLQQLASTTPSARACIAALAESYRTGQVDLEGVAPAAPPLFVMYYHLLHTLLPGGPHGITSLAGFTEDCAVRRTAEISIGVPPANSGAAAAAQRSLPATVGSWVGSAPNGMMRLVHCTSLSADALLTLDLSGAAVVIPASVCLPQEYIPETTEGGSPATPPKEMTFHAAAAACAAHGAGLAIFYNDVSDAVPKEMRTPSSASMPYPFGDYTGVRPESDPPADAPPGFMISGHDAAGVLSLLSEGDTLVATASISSGEAAAEGTAPLVFPQGAEKDLSKAWGLLEVIGRVDKSEGIAAEMQGLVEEMSIPDKSTWVSRRLRRHHLPEETLRELEAEPDWDIVFIECDRRATLEENMKELHRQHREETGLGSQKLAVGDLEIRFRDEPSVGSAVIREALDFLAKKVFLNPASCLLIPSDSTMRYFVPNPASLFTNPHWRQEYEILGRLLGLALWHRVTLELPLHPFVWQRILESRGSSSPGGDEEVGVPPASPEYATRSAMREVYPELWKRKVEWLRENNLAEMGVELPMTDTLLHLEAADEPEGDGGVAEAGAATSSSSSSSSSASAAPTPDNASPDSCISASGSGTFMTPTLPVLPSLVMRRNLLSGNSIAEMPQHPYTHTEVYLGSGLPVDEDDEACDYVNEETKEAYIDKLVHWRMYEGMYRQVEMIGKGLGEIVSENVVEELKGLMQPCDLGEVISGTPELDVDDWENNAKYYGGIDALSEEVQFFWKVLRKWNATSDQNRLANLLQFTTGSRRVPVGGFRYLMGANGGLHRFTLSKGVKMEPTSLPESHACICTLDLPPFESLEICEDKLNQITEDCELAFDEAFAD